MRYSGVPVVLAAVTLLWAGSTPGQEVCGNCEDDDGDGLGECYDTECWSDSTVCRGNYLSQPVTLGCSESLRFEEMWRASEYRTTQTPRVGDVDGDGDPEVVYLGGNPIELRIVDGKTGAVEHSIPVDNRTGQGYGKSGGCNTATKVKNLKLI